MKAYEKKAQDYALDQWKYSDPNHSLTKENVNVSTEDYQAGYLAALEDVRKETEGYYPHASAVTLKIVMKLRTEEA